MFICIRDAASGKKLRIEFARETPGECTLEPPDGDVALVDILPEIQTIANLLIEQSLAESAADGKPVTCAKGCNYCCYHLVAMSDHEALLLAHVVSLQEKHEQNRLKNAFTPVTNILEREGLLAELIDVHVNHFHDAARLTQVQRRYWELQIPCPFLLDGACSVYPFRPLVCRQYLASSPRNCCTQSFKADHLVHKIPMRYDVASALASFNGLAAKPTLAVPLPAILFANGMLDNFPRPKAAAGTILTAFMSHVQENFTRRRQAD